MRLRRVAKRPGPHRRIERKLAIVEGKLAVLLSALVRIETALDEPVYDQPDEPWRYPANVVPFRRP